MCVTSFRSIPERWCDTWKQHMVNEVFFLKNVNEVIPVAHKLRNVGDLWQWHQNSRSSSFYYYAFLIVHHLSPKVRFHLPSLLSFHVSEPTHMNKSTTNPSSHLLSRISNGNTSTQHSAAARLSPTTVSGDTYLDWRHSMYGPAS